MASRSSGMLPGGIPARAGAAGALVDSPALSERIHSVSINLALIADSFFWACWIFAFFYLRALNNNMSWLPAGVHKASVTRGSITLGLVVASVAIFLVASRLLPVRSPAWRWLSILALLLGLGAALYQSWGMWNLGFGMTDGAYASVFAGWMGAWLVHFFAAMLWLLTIVIQARPGGDSLLRPFSVVGFSRILIYLAAIYVLAYILLYQIA